MFLGLTGRDRDVNAGTCWSLLQVGFKGYFVLSMVLCLLSYFLGIFNYFPNIVPLTVEGLQIWRLTTSWMLPGIGSMAIINVLFIFYILYMYMPDIEKKYSTSYIVLQVLMQTFLCNVALTAVGYPLLLMGLGDFQTYLGYGMIPAIFIFIWEKVSQNPDEATRFCCFPCLIPMKFIPLCFLALYAIFGYFVPPAIYCLLGYYQFMIRKKSLLQLPLKVYRKFDSLMPTSVTEQPGYIKVSSVEANLRAVCLTQGCCDWGNNNDEQPFAGNQANNQRDGEYQNQSNNQKERVQVLGGGVPIGGSYSNPNPTNDFKSHWKDKEVTEGEPSDEVKQKQKEVPKLQSDENYQQFFQAEDKVGSQQNDYELFQNESVMSHKPLKKDKNKSDS